MSRACRTDIQCSFWLLGDNYICASRFDDYLGEMLRGQVTSGEARLF
jgi:hypothetical protein